ncbi:hypothetical protein [Cyanobacterium aponinum]|uniref:Uncharacterized protein n=1 Tax=Cyanobacterium aponinum 0216 TaxID=2676140 RepID=A0A844GRX3_9CHRO|nr:hypothetical protein [Cyanobacterium aponinum]MTF37498.1 hypothetical protein [Cyanobacterium aponinum 0216]
MVVLNIQKHDYSNYIVLKNMSRYFLKCYDERVTDEARVVFLTSSMAFSFFAIKSLNNVVYVQFIENDVKKLKKGKNIYLNNKIKKINKQLNITKKSFSDLNKRINKMREFRNNLVHCKLLQSEPNKVEYDCNDFDNPCYIKTQIFNEPSIFNLVNKDNAETFIDTVNDLETMWNKQCQKQFNREIIFSPVMQIK